MVNASGIDGPIYTRLPNQVPSECSPQVSRINPSLGRQTRLRNHPNVGGVDGGAVRKNVESQHQTRALLVIAPNSFAILNLAGFVSSFCPFVESRSFKCGEPRSQLDHLGRCTWRCRSRNPCECWEDCLHDYASARSLRCSMHSTEVCKRKASFGGRIKVSQAYNIAGI